MEGSRIQVVSIFVSCVSRAKKAKDTIGEVNLLRQPARLPTTTMTTQNKLHINHPKNTLQNQKRFELIVIE